MFWFFLIFLSFLYLPTISLNVNIGTVVDATPFPETRKLANLKNLDVYIAILKKVNYNCSINYNLSIKYNLLDIKIKRRLKHEL